MEIGFDEEEAVNITKIKQADVVSTLLEDNEANEEHQESHDILDIHLDKDVDPGTVLSDVQIKSPGLPEICNDEDVSLGVMKKTSSSILKKTGSLILKTNPVLKFFDAENKFRAGSLMLKRTSSVLLMTSSVLLCLMMMKTNPILM